MATQTKKPRLTRVQLADVVRTGNDVRGVGRARALDLLRRRTRHDAADELTGLAVDRRLEPGLRRAAVMGLYEMGGERASKALKLAAESADAEVAPQVALGLGRIGPADELPLVDEMVSISVDHLRDQAEFGAMLLSYRHALDEHTVRAPTGRQLQEIGDAVTHGISFGKVTAANVADVSAALRRQPIDVSTSESAAQLIVCGASTYVWVWTKTSLGGFERPSRAKHVAGLLLRRHPITDSLAVSAVGLVTPRRGADLLTIHRFTSGHTLYSGTLTGDEAAVKATKHPGLAAVDVQVGVRQGAWKVASGLSSSIVREARKPSPA